MKKVRGGCLIIEKAGEITRETAVKMSLQMSTGHRRNVSYFRGCQRKESVRHLDDEEFAGSLPKSQYTDLPLMNW